MRRREFIAGLGSAAAWPLARHVGSTCVCGPDGWCPGGALISAFAGCEDAKLHAAQWASASRAAKKIE